jgi:hypothetical protein
MAVCRAMSLSLLGIEAVAVEVEVDVSAGLPRFSIVGLPDAAVQEARERVRVAISNSGFRFPTKKVIVNLAPANLRKEGAAFDLPIALAILAAAGEVSQRCALVLSPRFGRKLISLHAEQAYAPPIPSAYRLQRAGSTFTNAAVRSLHPASCIKTSVARLGRGRCYR